MDNFFIDRHTRSSPLKLETKNQVVEFAREAMNATEHLNRFYLALEQLASQAEGKENLLGFLRMTKQVLLSKGFHYEQVPDRLDPARVEEALQGAGFVQSEAQKQAVSDQNRRQALTEKLGLKYFPRIHALFASIEQASDMYLMRGVPAREIVRPGGMVISIGSCFARNIGGFLKNFLDCSTVDVTTGEEVDSAAFLEYARGFAQKDPARTRAIAEADRPLMFYTIGISEMLLDEAGKTYSVGSLKSNPALARNKRATIQSPESIAAEVEEAIGHFRRINPSLEVVATVSPVPLDATFQRDLSILSADCLSKSTLRYAASLLCDPGKHIWYFPSFEFVRWLCPLVGLQPFAEDDGHPRHVSNRVVAAICLLFSKYFASREVFETCVRSVCAIDDVRTLNIHFVQEKDRG